MKSIFKPGEIKTFERLVQAEDIAKFESGTVHNVYATFALARDAEWVCRLFVLEMKEEQEEGIGTFVTVRHSAPALIGDKVLFTATVKSVERNEIVCSYTAYVGSRKIAEGEQGQKIIPKEKLNRIFGQLSKP